ncbi:MAG: hypothetical protein ACREIH_08525 [Nitrospiraceae bacterium]
MLTAVVVHKVDGLPGHGFFALARDLERLPSRGSKVEFFVDEVRRVYREWKKE